MNVQALPMHRFIDHDGNLVSQLPNWADLETLVGFYQDMVLTRTYDNKAVALQRTGKLGTYITPWLGSCWYCCGQSA